jgi:eukaryotic-like serine/threonine-protein kinase
MGLQGGLIRPGNMASQWELVKELFGAALNLSPEQRSAFLESRCKGHLDLRREVEVLLEADANAGSFLQHPMLEAATTPPPDTVEIIMGPYRLLERIGEGGMGQVWLAEQKQPVRRRVAIKLIKAGMDTREMLARFEYERQALAMMDHPAIAKVFDAGATVEGRPYFVMEYVAGVPITTYCDKHQLTIRQRIELFIPVCEAVQHAHQKAIIHRDLKPSNILVTEIDGKPMPRIIDFGVAKAVSQNLTAETMYTRIGAMVGTLGYMSPEQADPIGVDIDTRADIYSLGAVLYELLTGALPLETRKLPYDEVIRRLREQDALRPSTRLRTLSGQSALVARRPDAPALVRELRGDLDAIVLKALEKDRTRRYGSAAALAADIDSYLHNEPVAAHPPSAAYRAQKYIRRNRLGVTIAATAVLLLAGFAAVQTVELRHIVEERDRATRERDRADRVTQFATGMFKVYDSSEGRGDTITAREILDSASNGIGPGLSNDPALQAKMMFTVAQSYADLGLYSRAQPLVEQAVKIQQRTLGLKNRDTLASMSLLAEVLTFSQRSGDAEKLIRQTLDLERRVLGAENPETLNSMSTLSIILGNEARFAEKERLERQTLDVRRRVLGPEHPITLGSMRTLASALTDEGHFGEAETLERQTLDIERRVFGLKDLRTLSSTGALSETLRREGRLAEAEELRRLILDTDRQMLGPENPGILFDLEFEAIYLSLEGRFKAGDRLFREGLDIASKTNEPTQLANAWYAYACGAAVAGHREEALSYLGNAVDHGYALSEWIGVDPDLQSLRNDPRMEALVAKARRNNSARLP